MLADVFRVVASQWACARALSPRTLALFAFALWPVSASAADKLPNIVIFLVDDMGVMDCSVPMLADDQGRPLATPLNRFYRTPNLSRLADRGVRFSTFYATNLCSPSRISLLTGQNSARHRTTIYIEPTFDNCGEFGPPEWNWHGLTRASVTLPRLLRQRGYRTIHIGKGHFGPAGFEGADPRNLGFDVSLAGSSIAAPISYFGQENFGGILSKQARKYADPSLGAVPDLEEFHGTDAFLTEALTRKALAAVDEAVDADQPFFLYFAHYAAHSPFNFDPRFAPHYENSGRSHAAGNFAGLIEGVDESLGQLMKHLEARGVGEDTLLFFLGDNGTDAPLGDSQSIACADPLRGKKGTHYEGGCRVPFVASWLKVNSANTNQKRLPIGVAAIQPQMAAIYDLLPTILELVDFSAPTDYIVDGSSMRELLAGRPDPKHSQNYLLHFPHAPHNSEYFSSFRDGDWKVIYHYFGYPRTQEAAPRYQLFNLAKDPSESTDLSESNAAQLRRMAHGLITALERHEAVYPRSSANSSARLRPTIPSP